MKGHIRIEMLGGLSVWADGAPVLAGAEEIPLPWQLLCYAALNCRTEPAEAAELAAALWPGDAPKDAGPAVGKVVLALDEALYGPTPGPGGSPVLFEKGRCRWNPAVEAELDCEAFEALVRGRAGAALRPPGGAGGREQGGGGDAGDGAPPAEADPLARFAQAVGHYRGDLLPGLAHLPWVAPAAAYYRQLYHQALELLCSGLYAAGRHSELLQAATEAARRDPLEEANHLYIFRALAAMQMHRAVILAYNKTAALFAQELGQQLPEEIEAIHAAACEQVDVLEQDIMLIQSDLREVAASAAGGDGALYCSYEVFKYLYQMVARSSERTGASVVVVLMTLAPEGEVPARVTSAAMRQVKQAVLGGLLRKSDTVARYSKNQYIIMLSVDKAANAEKVTGRLAEKCAPLLLGTPLGLRFSTAVL